MENVNVIQDTEQRKIVVAKIQVPFLNISKQYLVYVIIDNIIFQNTLGTTIKFIDDQNEPLKNFVVMYFITEGNATNGIPEVALTDSLMGQIIISVNILVSNF